LREEPVDISVDFSKPFSFVVEETLKPVPAFVWNIEHVPEFCRLYSCEFRAS